MVRYQCIFGLASRYTHGVTANQIYKAEYGFLFFFHFLISTRGLKDSKGENLFIKCLSEMVIETREFDALLGRLGEDGTRRPGAVDKFQVNTQQILETVAKDTEAKGLFEDAVKLYDLASVSIVSF